MSSLDTSTLKTTLEEDFVSPLTAVIAFTVDGETHPEGFHAYYALKDG